MSYYYSFVCWTQEDPPTVVTVSFRYPPWESQPQSFLYINIQNSLKHKICFFQMIGLWCQSIKKKTNLSQGGTTILNLDKCRSCPSCFYLFKRAKHCLKCDETMQCNLTMQYFGFLHVHCETLEVTWPHLTQASDNYPLHIHLEIITVLLKLFVWS